MYQIIVRLTAILFYLLILLASVGFEIQTLWSTKSVLFVILGTGLLTLSGYRKDWSKGEIQNAICVNSMTAAYLTTFIELYSRLSGNLSGYEETMKAVAVSCRSLLYGFIIYSAFKQLNKENTYRQAENEEPAEDLKASGLTQREIEIVQLVRENLSNKEIGERLYISETTVKKHLSNIFKKLDMPGRESLK